MVGVTSTRKGNAEAGVDEVDREKTVPTPPDGGWGWMVVFGSFMIHVIADGITYTFGIFFVEFLKFYGEGKGATAWIASILVGITLGTGPIASALTNKYGCRPVTIAGAVLAAVGLVISVFAPNVATLCVTIGVCAGLGFGLIYLPAIVSVTCYFEKRRAFATGIAVCGSGLGTFIFAPLIEALVEEYAWKGAMLLVAGFVLNCTVFGALFRPLKLTPRHNKILSELDVVATEAEQQRLVNGVITQTSVPRRLLVSSANGKAGEPPGDGLRVSMSASNLTHSTPAHALRGQESHRSLAMGSNPMIGSGKPLYTEETAVSGPMYRKDVFYSGSLLNLPQYRSNPQMYAMSVTHIPRAYEEATGTSKASICCSCCSPETKDTLREMMDLSLLKDPIFILFAISNFLTSIGFNVPYVYIKDRALLLDISADDSSFLLAIIGIANTISRVVLGYISDKSWLNRLWLYNTALTICGVSTMLSAFCSDYTSLAVYSAVFGATAGAYVGLTSVILVDLLGLERLTNAFGLLLLFQGVASLLGPPIAGWLYDWLQSYDPGFYVAGATIAVSGAMLFAIPAVRWCQRRGEKPAAASATVTSVESYSLSEKIPTTDTVPKVRVTSEDWVREDEEQEKDSVM